MMPIVSVIGITDLSAENLVKGILRCDQLPLGTTLGNNITGYKWKIDTKYYNAEAYICPVDVNDNMPNDILQMVEALVIYFDAEQEDAISCLQSIEEKIKQYQAEILLLVCNSCSSNVSSKTRESALNWCLKHHFELIELNPIETSKPTHEEDLEDDEIIPEKIGIDRVIEALHTHHWVNATMKGDPNTEDTSDDFSELFSQLLSMKESVRSLPLNERKAHAEQVVAAFWRAIGGDEEELGEITE
ncbi:alpha- and gamma-adaptin-binding protein p34-like [Ctenocephalides felis]|uniref:alpha- and gamma-adaptin-binding protein p34-like n=1 Tax=Ctenocephalides felis TaxID=7515 RepID=UPI000E6E1114|nr:alpha- and gamma-adaptin-binding protein p34-like [Ctenocephalides felis]